MKINAWMRSAVVACCLFLAACGAQEQTKQAAQEPEASDVKVLFYGTNAEFAPFEYVEAGGALKGFDIDLIEAIAEAGGWHLVPRNMPWDGLFPSLSTGDTQAVIAAVTITDDRKKTMDFTQPYFEIKQVVLMPEGKKITSVQDLKNLNRVGVSTGHTGDLVAQKILGNDSKKIARFDSMPLVFKELENGGLDAAISDSAVVKNYVKNNDSQKFVIIEVPDFEVEHYGIAVKKGNQALIDELNVALKKVQDSGQYNEIYQRYFVE